MEEVRVTAIVRRILLRHLNGYPDRQLYASKDFSRGSVASSTGRAKGYGKDGAESPERAGAEAERQRACEERKVTPQAEAADCFPAARRSGFSRGLR